MAKKAFVYDGTNWVDIAQSTTDLSNYAYIPSTQFSFRNKIINGDFRINQRGYTSGSNLASGAYGFDRWKSNYTNTTLTFTSAPQGQTVTINVGGSVSQIIERSNMPAGTYVLSWTGTAIGSVFNSGATAPIGVLSPLVVTLDGSEDVVVQFGPAGAGTATLQNVQLEAGSVPSSFEYRPIGAELALCQRYYNRISGSATASLIGTGYAFSTTGVNFPVTAINSLRRAPSSIDASGVTVARFAAAGTPYNTGTFSLTSSLQSSSIPTVTYTHGSGVFTAGDGIIFSLSSSGYLGFNAEL
jgi:hypothetical protein